MSHAIAQKFHTWSLLKFAAPSMLMMVFMSLYTIVDGMFVSRFVSSDALSSVNIVYPAIGLLLAVGIMLATGGSALVSRLLGEGKKEKAREAFTLLACISLLFSILFAVSMILWAKPISLLLGSDEALLKNCKIYLIGLAVFSPACTLQSFYQSFFVTAGKPGLGLGLTITAGIVNMILDYIFIVPLQLGVLGAALATGIGQSIPAIIGTIFFFSHKRILYYQRFHFYGKEVLSACANGSSEMVTQLSTSFVTVLFNLILMKLEGADGVAAITIILYGQFMLSSLFLGFSIGVAPIFGYRLGSKDYADLKRLFSISLKFVLFSSVLITALAFFGTPWIVTAFLPRDNSAWSLANVGFHLFSLGYLFCGTSVFASGFFTAISDGKRSALISFLRTFIFIVGSLLILPKIIGITGVWLAIPLAEFLTVFISLYLLRKTIANLA